MNHKQKPPPGLPAGVEATNVTTRAIEDTLRGYLNTTEPKTVKFLVNTWNAEREAIKFNEIILAVNSGKVQDQWLIRWQIDYANFINTNLDEQWRAAQLSGAGEIAEGLAANLGITVELPEVAERLEQWIRTRGATEITRFTADQTLAMQNVLNHYVVDLGLGPKQLEPILRPMIGLTSREELAVQRFWDTLIDEGKLSTELINSKTSRYAQLLNRRRANMIARTEIANAYSQGMLEEMRQGVDQGLITGTVTKVWLTAKDERTCPWCGPLDGDISHETVFLEQPFTVKPIVGRKTLKFSEANGGLVPPLHPNGRCTVIYQVWQ